MWLGGESERCRSLHGKHRKGGTKCCTKGYGIVALGMRRGEALGLRWDDIDLVNGTMTMAMQLQRVGGNFGTTRPRPTTPPVSSHSPGPARKRYGGIEPSRRRNS